MRRVYNSGTWFENMFRVRRSKGDTAPKLSRWVLLLFMITLLGLLGSGITSEVVCLSMKSECSCLYVGLLRSLTERRTTGGIKDLIICSASGDIWHFDMKV